MGEDRLGVVGLLELVNRVVNLGGDYGRRALHALDNASLGYGDLGGSLMLLNNLDPLKKGLLGCTRVEALVSQRIADDDALADGL